ncbi:hypothetical protein P171DRAFT_484957 [Karstenula rhodostoma CBS 690.94]|uniref:Uncharacterized protein n=1 Tax=Karstenula rhodostoma CBS 690.94 TaxID=1392251 RepID=A0A9P4PIN2_9PLEO|nr:hypothetical protein P171DRAFT_484957 [Karstenula rhodostoma CBS 690.94]
MTRERREPVIQHSQRSSPLSTSPPVSSSSFAAVASQTHAATRPPSSRGADGNAPTRPALVSRATGIPVPPSPTRPRPRRRSVHNSKSTSAVPTLSSFAIPRALPTYWLPTMTNSTGGASSQTAADLLRQVAMQR